MAEKPRDIPAGFRFVDGRWYWRPTNQAARLALADIAPGTLSMPAGKTLLEALSWYEESIANRIVAYVKSGKGHGGINLPSWSKAQRLAVPKSAARSKKELLEEEQNQLETLLAASNEDDGWVYFIQAGKTGRIKVGYTGEVDGAKARLQSLQTSATEQLELLDQFKGNMKLEKLCHYVFRHFHIRGEWFKNEGIVFHIRLRAREVGLKIVLSEFVNSDKLRPLE